MFDYSFTYSDLEYFLLIFTRITCFISVAPFFGTNNVPRRTKAGLGFFITVIIYGVMQDKPALTYTTLLGYTAVVLKEGITGLLIGYGASICNSIVLLAGRIADMETGLSMASVMDPTTREQASLSGAIYQYSVMLILIVTDMHHFILRALVDSYRLIPVNGAVFHSDRLVAAMTRFLADYVVIGFRICLPIFAAILVMNSVLGILAKVAPQMNMFTVGIQMKILVGLGVMLISLTLLPVVADFIFREMKFMMQAMVEAMT